MDHRLQNVMNVNLDFCFQQVLPLVVNSAQIQSFRMSIIQLTAITAMLRAPTVMDQKTPIVRVIAIMDISPSLMNLVAASILVLQAIIRKRTIHQPMRKGSIRSKNQMEKKGQKEKNLLLPVEEPVKPVMKNVLLVLEPRIVNVKLVKMNTISMSHYVMMCVRMALTLILIQKVV